MYRDDPTVLILKNLNFDDRRLYGYSSKNGGVINTWVLAFKNIAWIMRRLSASQDCSTVSVSRAWMTVHTKAQVLYCAFAKIYHMCAT